MNSQARWQWQQSGLGPDSAWDGTDGLQPDGAAGQRPR